MGVPDELIPRGECLDNPKTEDGSWFSEPSAASRSSSRTAVEPEELASAADDEENPDVAGCGALEVDDGIGVGLRKNYTYNCLTFLRKAAF